MRRIEFIDANGTNSAGCRSDPDSNTHAVTDTGPYSRTVRPNPEFMARRASVSHVRQSPSVPGSFAVRRTVRQQHRGAATGNLRRQGILMFDGYWDLFDAQWRALLEELAPR